MKVVAAYSLDHCETFVSSDPLLNNRVVAMVTCVVIVDFGPFVGPFDPFSTVGEYRNLFRS